MKIKNKIFVFLTLFVTLSCGNDSVFAQNHNYELFLSITTSGGGAGMKVRWGIQSKWIKTLSLELGGVRSESEFPLYDPYYGYAKIGQQRYILLTPLYFGLQRVIFEAAIENNVRPFLVGEVGPVFGAWFPVGYGFKENIKRGTTGLAFGSFLGAGVEIGSNKRNKFTLSAGFRYIGFPKRLGDQATGAKEFNAFLIRFGFITSF